MISDLRPITGLATILGHLRWALEDPEVWFTPQGSVIHVSLTNKVEAAKTWLGISDWFEQDLWRQAALHYDSAGLQSGVCVHLVKRAKGEFARDPALAGSALMLTTGAMMIQQRRAELGLADAPTCKRCGGAPETPYHCGYECPDTAMIDSADFKATDALIDQAAAASSDDKALFTRALILNHMVESDTVFPIHKTQLMYFAVPGSPTTPFRWASACYFTDGSGGAWGSWPSCRRVALAVVGLSWHFDTNARVDLKELEDSAIEMLDCGYDLPSFNKLN